MRIRAGRCSGDLTHHCQRYPGDPAHCRPGTVFLGGARIRVELGACEFDLDGHLHSRPQIEHVFYLCWQRLMGLKKAWRWA